MDYEEKGKMLRKAKKELGSGIDAMMKAGREEPMLKSLAKQDEEIWSKKMKKAKAKRRLKKAAKKKVVKKKKDELLIKGGKTESGLELQDIYGERDEYRPVIDMKRKY